MSYKNFWQIFAKSGDPAAYLEYTRFRTNHGEQPEQSAKTKRGTLPPAG